ncbi:MAG: CsbD family protein [Burkholderiaceae bacterium]|nr:CsbD family protein [Burkholderiaceae bacterium]
MNKDQVKGSAKEVAGKIQQGVGRAVDSKEQQIKGVGKQVEGNVQKNIGNLKEGLKDAAKHS